MLIYRKRIIHLLTSSLTGFFLLVFVSPAFAHGGVDYGRDACILTVGPYQMNFTGYLPEVDRNGEFCDDIPDVGLAYVVLDYIDKPLRSMKVGLRILEDIDNIGVTATLEDLGGKEKIEADTIYYVEPAVYPKGTLLYQREFKEAGNFIGILTAQREGDGETFTSVFPFSVGFGTWSLWLYSIIALIAVMLLGAYVYCTLYGLPGNKKKKA